MTEEEWEHKTISEGYLWTRVFHKESLGVGDRI